MTDYKKITQYNLKQLGEHTASRKSQVCIYSDSTHFIFEILQNADDHNATEIEFSLSDKEFVITHNGDPFTEENVKAVTFFGASTSIEDANKTGRFGIGFKSVFTFTATPIIESGNESFKIYDLYKIEEYEERTKFKEFTRITLPFNHDTFKPDFVDYHLSQEKAYKLISLRLQKLNERSLLFTKNLSKIKWSIDSIVGSIKRKDERLFQGTKRTIFSNHEIAGAYLIYSQEVYWNGEKIQPLEIAFHLNRNDRIQLKKSKLYVLFNSELYTGLNYIVNGPFITTPNRENILSGHERNKYLISIVGKLWKKIILERVKNDNLSTDLLETFPIQEDDIPDLFLPIQQEIQRIYKEENVIKSVDDKYYCIKELCFTKSEKLINLLDSIDLKNIFGSQLKWARKIKTTSRYYKFLLSINILEITFKLFKEKLQNLYPEQISIASATDKTDWIFSKENDWLVRLYKYISSEVESSNSFRNIYVFKCENTHKNPTTYFGSSNSQFPLEGYTGTIHPELFKGDQDGDKILIDALSKIGVTKINEKDKIRIILRKYKDSIDISEKEHLNDIVTFLNYNKKFNDSELFTYCTILKDSSNEYRIGNELYLSAPYSDKGIDLVYENLELKRRRFPLWNGYKDLNRSDFITFAKSIGATDSLTISNVSIWGNPLFKTIPEHIRHAKESHYKVSKDYEIIELRDITDFSHRALGNLILQTIIGNQDKLYAEFTPSNQHSIRKIPSSIIVQLKKIKWVEDLNGDYKTPDQVQIDELSPKFEEIKNHQNIVDLIGFGLNSNNSNIQTILQEIGIDENIISQALPLLNAESNFNDLLKNLIKANQRRGGLPKRSSKNREKRKEEIRSKYTEENKVKYSPKEVNKRDQTTKNKQKVREYLNSNYTNEIGELICQMCNQCMPFKLVNNKQYYFHAVEIFKTYFTYENEVTYLALCPNCSSKYKYFNQNNLENLEHFRYELLEPREENDTSLTLQLKEHNERIYFTEKHLYEIRIILLDENKSM